MIVSFDVNKNIMYGSLSEFIDVRDKFRLQDIPRRGTSMEISAKAFSQQKIRGKKKNTLVYQTLDKSIYLKSQANRQKQKQYERRKFLKEAIKSEPKPKKSQSPHWVETVTFDKSNITAKHKLLKAVIKTKQLENQDNFNTLYDKSLGRIISAYSKIKTQPIDSLLPPKLIQVQQLPKQQQLSPLRSRSSSIEASRLLSLENSVKWAKKHGKKVESFYEQLGKSFQLIDKERPGKSNYKLQKQVKEVQDQQRRRGLRRKFLKQIEKRISKYSVSNKQKNIENKNG